MRAYVSVRELFSIGIGPSSSHTVGPMRAAKAFVTALGPDLGRVEGVRVRLYGSLGATGIGHGTPGAVLAGLAGHDPETCDPAMLPAGWAALGDGGVVLLAGAHPVVMAQRDVELAPLTRLRPAHERHAVHRPRRGGGGGAHPHLLLDRRRLHRGRRTSSRTRRSRSRTPTPPPRELLAAVRRARPLHRRDRARQRGGARLAAGGARRDRRDLDRDARLHRGRHGRGRAAARAARGAAPRVGAASAPGRAGRGPRLARSGCTRTRSRSTSRTREGGAS